MSATLTRRAPTGARVLAVVVVATLLQAIAPLAVSAAGPNWFRTPGGAGLSAYSRLSDGPTGGVYDSTVAHGNGVGTFRFRPGGAASAGSPGQSASGVGWATSSALTGSVPGGTWQFGAAVTTDIPAGTASGFLVAAMYAVRPGGGSRLLGVAQSGQDVLANSGATSVTLSKSLPPLTFDGEHLAVEFYLNVSSNQAPAGGWSTTLRQGDGGDRVSAPGAVQAPEVGPPSDLVVTGVGDNRVSLSWRASSDGRVTGYEVRRATSASGPWAPVGVVAATSYADTGLTNGVRYYHSVVALGDGGARSTPSNTTSAVPADAEPPAPPQGLTVRPVGAGRLEVTWAASGSPDAVAYELQRSGGPGGPWAVAAGPSAATSHADQGLAASSVWYYRVIAIDDDGLRSAPTDPVSGRVAPPAPRDLRVVGVDDGTVQIAWSGTTTVAGYRVERATSTGSSWTMLDGLVTSTSFTDTGLTNGVTYYYRVSSEDADGVRSSPTAAVEATPRPSDRPAPPALTGTPIGNGSIRLDWDESTSRSVVGYVVRRSSSPDGPYEDITDLITDRSYIDGPRPIAVPNYYVVHAVTAAGERSLPQTPVRFTVPPSTPTGLRLIAVSETNASLQWNATGEPIAGYRLLRAEGTPSGFADVSGLISGTQFVDSGLVLGRDYYYQVQAIADDGTGSDPSASVHAVPVNGPPTPPSGLTVLDTVAGGQLRITWAVNPEPDIVSYRIRRATSSGGPWTPIANVVSNTYLDDGLTNGVVYHYEVVAVDDAGFASLPSTPASGVPTDITAPPAPVGVIARALSSSISVLWSQAPGAVGYAVLRSTAPGGPYAPASGVIAANSFQDGNITRGATYYYVVQAVDASGNRSAISAEVSATVAAGGTTTPPPGPGPGPGPTTPGPTSRPSPGPGGPGPIAIGPTNQPGPGPGEPTTPVGPPSPGGDPGEPTAGPTDPVIAIGGIPPQAVESNQPQLPGGGDPDGNGGIDDFPGALTGSAGQLIEDVQEAVERFRVPLFLIVLLLAYLILQGRFGREALPKAFDTGTPHESDDDVEYLL